MTREGTPWIGTHGFYPTFDNKKDAFIQKYQVLLDYQEMLENKVYGAGSKSKLRSNIL